MKYDFKAIAAVLALTHGMAGCGGGGGGGSMPNPPPPASNPPPAPVDDSGMSVGAITGFGSVYVNGIRFETGGASISVNGEVADESALALGQIVTVRGRISDDSNGSADAISYHSDLEGPVASIDAATGRLTVLGQTVLVNAATVFDAGIAPRSLAGLQPGENIEVSAFLDADGSFVASRIERHAAMQLFEVRGVVTDLDGAASRFRLNDLSVDYAGAVIDDFPASGIAAGDHVEVKGGAFGPNGELLATRVERNPGGLNDMGDFAEIEIEGLITRFAAVTDFDVAGHAIATNSSTVFENGTADDIGPNVKVEVEGAVDDAGVLVARRVSLRLDPQVRIAAPIDAVDAATASLTVLGLDAVTDAATAFEDSSSQGLRSLRLADLGVGDYIEVRARLLADGGLVAVRIERDDPESDVALRGPVETVTGQDFSILGIAIQTSATTDFANLADQPIAAADFFAGLQPGVVVKVQGSLVAAGTIAAREAEFED